MKLYLAGPDVFRPDALVWAEESRALCAAHGHVALIPLDGVETSAPGIYRANIELIRAADAVLANLEPFRGCEPDSGTCVEVGFALALGKPVIGYLRNQETVVERVARRRPIRAQGLAEGPGTVLGAGAAAVQTHPQVIGQAQDRHPASHRQRLLDVGRESGAGDGVGILGRRRVSNGGRHAPSVEGEAAFGIRKVCRAPPRALAPVHAT